MQLVFADTGYWLALLLPRDELHARAKAAGQEFLQDATIITSDLVIVEVLNYLHDHSIELRRKAFAIFSSFRSTSRVEIVPSTPSLLDEAGRLYTTSADKEMELYRLRFLRDNDPSKYSRCPRTRSPFRASRFSRTTEVAVT